MTNTPHGQVPEALIDLIDAYAETRHRCGGIYNAKTEAARNAVLEALSGVQAQSAVDDPTRWLTVVYRDISPGDEARLLAEHPKASAMSWSHAIRDRDAARAVLAKWGTQPQAGAVPQGWKAVPVNPTPEMWKAAKSVPDPNPPYPPHYGLVWDAMLAASPTPPAEQTFITPETGNSASAKGAAITSESGTPPAEQQAAPKAAPGEPKVAVPQGLISAACFAIRNKHDGGGKVLEQLRRYSVGDRSQPLAPQQAAPKAAPGEPSDYQIRAITTAYEQGVGKGHQAYKSGKEIASPYDSAYGCDLAWQYGYGEGKEQAQRGVKPDRQCLALYTAPQPAPAPLSEMPYEKRKAIQEGEQIGASDAWFKARHGMLDTVDRRNVFRAGFDRGWSAAIAAQGGK